MRVLRRFKTDERGATAVIFGLALVPLLGMAGAAIDYSRAASARADLQRALDGTALALVRDAGRLNDAQLEAKGRVIFKTLVRAETGVVPTDIRVVKTNNRIRVSATGTVPTTIMGALGFEIMKVGSEAESAWGNRSIELALVLDNTGSMGQQGKIEKLREATHKLLDSVVAANVGTNRISVSLVPFDTQVRLDERQFANREWLRPLRRAEIEGPCGSLRINPQTSLLPADHIAARAAWTGYVTDRDRTICDGNRRTNVDLNVARTAPDSLWAHTLYPMVRNEERADLPRIVPLTRDLGGTGTLRQAVSSMRPRGCTNVTLGAMWGLETLSPSLPFAEGSAFGTPNVDKVMILLTDGWNTRDAFSDVCSRSGASTEIDSRTQTACDAVKASGVTLYTIRVVEGSASLLRACASRVTDPTSPYRRPDGVPELYYDVTDPNQIAKVFQTIIDQILQTRLTH